MATGALVATLNPWLLETVFHTNLHAVFKCSSFLVGMTYIIVAAQIIVFIVAAAVSAVVFCCLQCKSTFNNTVLTTDR